MLLRAKYLVFVGQFRSLQQRPSTLTIYESKISRCYYIIEVHFSVGRIDKLTRPDYNCSIGGILSDFFKYNRYNLNSSFSLALVIPLLFVVFIENKLPARAEMTNNFRNLIFYVANNNKT